MLRSPLHHLLYSFLVIPLNSFEEACSKVPEIVSKNGFAVLAEIKTSEIFPSHERIQWDHEKTV